MNNDVRDIKKWLKRPGTKLHDLSPGDLETYHKYRVRKLLQDRQVLLPKELNYLLCETGNGALRFDLDISEVLVGKKAHVSDKRAWIYANSDEIKSIKWAAEKAINSDRINLVSPFAAKYKLRTVSYNPLLFEKRSGKKKIFIYVIPNGWLLPDDNFLSMIKTASANGATPFFIAKKIHGILFPTFKTFGMGGVNTYTGIVSKKTKKGILDCNKKLDKLLPVQYATRVEYHGRYVDEDEFLSKNSLIVDQFIGERIEALNNNSIFLGLDFENTSSFKELVGQMKRSKIKNALQNWEHNHTQTIEALKK